MLKTMVRFSQRFVNCQHSIQLLPIVRLHTSQLSKASIIGLKVYFIKILKSVRCIANPANAKGSDQDETSTPHTAPALAAAKARRSTSSSCWPTRLATQADIAHKACL